MNTLKIRVNDRIDVYKCGGAWRGKLFGGHVRIAPSDDLGEAIEHLIDLDNWLRDFKIILDDQEYRVNEQDKLTGKQQDSVRDALSAGLESIDLTIRVGDKVMLLSTEEYLFQKFYKGTNVVVNDITNDSVLVNYDNGEISVTAWVPKGNLCK